MEITFSHMNNFPNYFQMTQFVVHNYEKEKKCTHQKLPAFRVIKHENVKILTSIKILNEPHELNRMYVVYILWFWNE